MQALDVTVTPVERRIVSRDNALSGLGRWLESCRLSAGLDALALSDASGCLIAGAGVSRICEELAALAPHPLVAAPLACAANSQSIARGQAYLVAPIGRVNQGTLTRFADGCARILAL